MRGSDPASAWRRFLSIQAFKAHPAAIMDGVNFARVIAFYLYDTSSAGWFKKMTLALCFSPEVSFRNSGADVMTFYSYRSAKRPDYDHIADALSDAAGSTATKVEVRDRVRLSQAFRTLSHWRQGWAASAGLGTGWFDRVAVAALISRFRSITTREFAGFADGYKRVVTFCDAAPYENLVAQLSKRSGAHTITAQHGQYRHLAQVNVSPDAEAYANFVSDTLLCWGEATRQEFAKAGVEPDRIKVVGWIREWDDGPETREPTNTFGVMLNGENGATSNIPLIEAANVVAEVFDLTFVVRTHPSHNSAAYRDRVSRRCSEIRRYSAGEYRRAVDFSLSHMSGATIEMLQVGSPVYVLDDGLLADCFRAPGLSFSSIDAVVEAIHTDLASADGGQGRVHGLKRWFNDDNNQSARIHEEIHGGVN